MRVKKWLLVMAMMVAGVVNATQGPNIEYSADSYMETADGVQQGLVYVIPGVERREYIEDGQSMAMILRHDKKLVWILMPDDKMYMETKFPKEGRKDDLSSYEIEQTMIGPETVNGVKTTKSKIIMTGPNDTKMGGFSWVSREGIMVKMDAIAMEKKKKERFKIELQNLKIGKQDPSLFEIPEGYTKMDMGGFGKMMMGDDDKDDDDEVGDDDGNDGNQPPPKKKKGFGFKDAIDLIK